MMRRILVSALVVILTACETTNQPTTPSPAVGSTSGTLALPPANSDGAQRVFELTFIADGEACQNLPPQARRRSYTATASAGTPLMHLTGATFAPVGDAFPTWNVLYTRLSETYGNVSGLDELWFQDPPIWEALSDDTYLVIYGTAEGHIGDDYAAVPFWARFEYCGQRKPVGQPECQVPPTTCFSRNHRLIVRTK
jgi:hypothetical protein